MPLHIGKGQTAGDAIKRALGYIKDPAKTENGILVTSYGCTPQTAEAEFMLMRREYLTITGRRRGKDDVLAYHLRQSFKPGEITPEKQIELAANWQNDLRMVIMRLLWQFIIIQVLFIRILFFLR